MSSFILCPKYLSRLMAYAGQPTSKWEIESGLSWHPGQMSFVDSPKSKVRSLVMLHLPPLSWLIIFPSLLCKPSGKLATSEFFLALGSLVLL